jgi:hypothetical protein
MTFFAFFDKLSLKGITLLSLLEKLFAGKNCSLIHIYRRCQHCHGDGGGEQSGTVYRIGWQAFPGDH